MRPQFRKYVDIDLQGKKHNYRIQSPYRSEGDLAISHARRYDDGESTNECDNPLEAQIFTKCRLPPKLYLSRKRRIQRLKKSNNIEDVVDYEDAKILVSARPGGKLGIEAATRYDYSSEDFPPLCKPHGNHPSDALQNLGSCNMPVSFAEVASVPPGKMLD